MAENTEMNEGADLVGTSDTEYFYTDENGAFIIETRQQDESDDVLSDENDADWLPKKSVQKPSSSQRSTSVQPKKKGGLTAEEKEMKFIKCLEDTDGLVLLSKSQVPQIKTEKKKAAQKVVEFYMKDGTESFNVDQVLKKIANLKQKIKAKADVKKTGNKTIDMKPSEKLFWDLIRAQDNPAITRVNSACVIGVGEPTLPIQKQNQQFKESIEESLDVLSVEEPIKEPIKEQVAPDASKSPIPGKKPIPPVLLSAKRRRLERSPSRSSPLTIDTASLRDEVLHEQLELIRFQKQELQLKAKRDEIEHNSKMELLAIKTN